MWNFWLQLLKAKEQVTVVLFDNNADSEEGYQNFVFFPQKSLKKALMWLCGGFFALALLAWGITVLFFSENVNPEKNQLLKLQQQVEENEEYILQLTRFMDGESINPKALKLAKPVKNTLKADSLDFVTPFYAPVKGGYVTRGYQEDIQHFGTDVAVATGTPVLSVGYGRVLFADKSQDGGFVIAVQHANGYITVYKHNKELLKSIGTTVNKGDTLAFSGNSGEITTGPHLHFEIWQNGVSLDPKPLVKNW